MDRHVDKKLISDRHIVTGFDLNCFDLAGIGGNSDCSGSRGGAR
jgi:hypothetical protein